MPACQCGWVFYASVRTLRIADRTHGFHLDRVHPAAVGFILSAAWTPCSPPPPPFLTVPLALGTAVAAATWLA